jgi:hypothetical protein
MPITINGSGTVTGISATGISAQPAFPGNILQVVSATYGTNTTSSSATFADTGLTATITPSSASSKILILVYQNGVGKVNNHYVKLRLLRSVTEIIVFENEGGWTNSTATNRIGSVGTCYLDSPNTTSATTYKTQFASAAGGATVYVQAGSAVSTITLMEIAA